MAETEPRGFGRDYERSVSASDDPVEVRRYVDALRRNWLLIVLFAGMAATSAFLLTRTQHESYRSTAKIVFEQVDSLSGPGDVESVKRELATLQTLLETPRILDRAAAQVPGLSADEVDKKVSTSVDANANIISVVATDEDPATAAAFANTVATAFIATRRGDERAQLQRARARLVTQLDELLQRSPGSATEIAALRARLSELSVQIAGAGNELRIAERALPADSPYAPRPVRDALIAFFASLFVAAIVVFVREQMRSHVNSARELGQLLQTPILARVPWVRARDRRKAIVTGNEYEAYQTLQASLRFKTRSAKQTIVLVTSAVSREGKSRVTAGLGLALAQSGAATLLVSGDLRAPTLHEVFDITPKMGLADILSASPTADHGHVRSLITDGAKAVRPKLSVLSSPAKRTDAVDLLSSDRLGAFFKEVAKLPYVYVIVDSPPLLGIADTRLVAEHVDLIVVVARPDRLTTDLVLDLREALNTTEIPVLGFVAVGVGSQHSSYYAQREATVFESPPDSRESQPA